MLLIFVIVVQVADVTGKYVSTELFLIFNAFASGTDMAKFSTNLHDRFCRAWMRFGKKCFHPWLVGTQTRDRE